LFGIRHDGVLIVADDCFDNDRRTKVWTCWGGLAMSVVESKAEDI
jgi:hypothetical protein